MYSDYRVNGLQVCDSDIRKAVQDLVLAFSYIVLCVREGRGMINTIYFFLSFLYLLLYFYVLWIEMVG